MSIKARDTGGAVATAGTQLSFGYLKGKQLAINVNGRLTPDGVLKKVLPRTANQQRLNLKAPNPNGAAIAAAKANKGKAPKPWWKK